MPEIRFFMKYLRLKSTSPYYNLAVEEALLREERDDVFMLWQNEPTVVIGKNQNAYAEVNLDFAAEQGIRISRRITGGGAVYHDLANINYTFISGGDGHRVLDYAYFTEPILSALAELGLSCTLSGRNDLECEGRKFSGNAQYAWGGRILHHGTILVDTDVQMMSRVLRVDREKLSYRAVKSHRGRVVNLSELLGKDFSAERLMDHIESYVIEKWGATPCEVPEGPLVEELCRRNESREWIYTDRRYLTGYSVQKKQKYPFGVVKIDMELGGEVIQKLVISGDFFELLPVEELEGVLVGRSLSHLPPIDVSAYIGGMSTEELFDLLRPAKD